MESPLFRMFPTRQANETIVNSVRAFKGFYLEVMHATFAQISLSKATNIAISNLKAGGVKHFYHMPRKGEAVNNKSNG